jgi:hypothetical protein
VIWAIAQFAEKVIAPLIATPSPLNQIQRVLISDIASLYAK